MPPDPNILEANTRMGAGIHNALETGHRWAPTHPIPNAVLLMAGEWDIMITAPNQHRALAAFPGGRQH